MSVDHHFYCVDSKDDITQPNIKGPDTTIQIPLRDGKGDTVVLHFGDQVEEKLRSILLQFAVTSWGLPDIGSSGHIYEKKS